MIYIVEMYSFCYIDVYIFQCKKLYFNCLFYIKELLFIGWIKSLLFEQKFKFELLIEDLFC